MELTGQQIEELNDNWIRIRTWDLPTDLLSFLSQISSPETPTATAAANFLKTPAARPMPQKLRAQVEQFIKDSTLKSSKVQSKAAWNTLRLEPYDPDARDGDGDGIVQEGTAWERPVGSRMLDATGKEITKGRTSYNRPNNHRLVDANGIPISFTPSYQRSDVGTIGETVGMIRSITPEAEQVDDVEATTPTPPATTTSNVDASRPKRVGSTPDPVPTLSLDAAEESPGTSEDSGDRPELVEPRKPRAPYTPSPPPFSGRAAALADLADGDFERLLELLDEEGYWILDFETTGFDHGNVPTQYALVYVKNGRIEQRITQYVNPDRPLSDWSRQHLRDGEGNPLTEEWLEANGISVNEAAARIAELVDGEIVVAHNASFDMEVLERIAREARERLSPSGTLDTLALMRMGIPKGEDDETGPRSHALGSLAAYLGYDLGDGAHDAIADVEATNEVLRRGLEFAESNERADRRVLDSEYMAQAYEQQKRDHEIALAKHRDAMRDYNRDLVTYRRALAESKEESVADVRVPYVPGSADSDVVVDQASRNRESVRDLLKQNLIEMLANLREDSVGDDTWEMIRSAVQEAMGSTATNYEEIDPTQPVLARRRRWLAENLGRMIDNDHEAVAGHVTEALDLLAETQLSTQVYVPATELAATQILNEGRIRTGFEGPSEVPGVSLRDKASREETQLGVPRGTADRQRPIYGFLPKSGEDELGLVAEVDPTKDPATVFGEILFRLKDDVRARTTASLGDSHDESGTVAVPLTDSAREALLASMPEPRSGSAQDVRSGLLHAMASDGFIEDAASIAARQWIKRLPEGLRRVIEEQMREREVGRRVLDRPRHFAEAQIHGGVSLDDVAEIVIPDEENRLGDGANDVLRLAREKGIEVRTSAGRVPVATASGWKFVNPEVLPDRLLEPKVSAWPSWATPIEPEVPERVVELPYVPGQSIDPARWIGRHEEFLIDLGPEWIDIWESLSDEDKEKLAEEDIADSNDFVRYMSEKVVEEVISRVRWARRSRLYVALPEKALKKIVADGRMKSQFESGSSGGMFNTVLRRDVEFSQMGVPTDLADELRPIYGFFSDDGYPFGTLAAQCYGPVVVHLKKSVRSRTTITDGDSLDHGLIPLPATGEIDEDDLDRLFAWTSRSGVIARDSINSVLQQFYEEVLGESYIDYYTGEDSGYTEIQVHGGVSVDDIDYIEYPENYAADNPEVLAQLDRLGIQHGTSW